MRLAIKVVPSSARSSVSGWIGDALKVRVTAPAEKGAANAAVAKLLAEVLGLHKDCIHVVAGATQPRKVIEIVGLSDGEVRQRLSKVRGRPSSA